MMKKDISIIGVPIELGQSVAGVSKGPDAIRKAGIQKRLENLSYRVHDLGDVEIDQPSSKSIQSKNKLKHLNEIATSSERVAKVIDKVVDRQDFPLVLGGDHSMAIGSIAGIAKHYDDLGVIWYDAHGDLNSAETSPSGNVHGMPLAVNLGIGHEKLTHILDYQPKIKPEHIVIIGARSLDDGEKELIKNRGIRMYTMPEIKELGMEKVMTETITYLQNVTDGIHLSLDLDALDPSETPGVGTPADGGISFEDSSIAMTVLSKADVVTSAELVEVNPVVDQGNKTATVAVDLTERLFGEKK